MITGRCVPFVPKTRTGIFAPRELMNSIVPWRCATAISGNAGTASLGLKSGDTCALGWYVAQPLKTQVTKISKQLSARHNRRMTDSQDFRFQFQPVADVQELELPQPRLSRALDRKAVLQKKVHSLC